MAKPLGAEVLTMLAPGLKVNILEALETGPTPRAQLSRAVGSPAHTTLHSHIKELEEIGSLAKHRRNVFPGTIDYELTPAGHAFLSVTAAVASWLQRAPSGPIAIGSANAKRVIRALVEGWSTTILGTLGTRPMCLTELDEAIDGINHPSIERRLAAMLQTGLIRTHGGGGRGRPYTLTEWGRAGMHPVVAAIHWEETKPAGAAA